MKLKMIQKIIYVLNLIIKFKKNIQILYILFVIDTESHLNLNISLTAKIKRIESLISFII